MQLSLFEMYMAALFCDLFGGSSEGLEQQEYWPFIQELKALAIQGILPEGRCPECGADVLGGEALTDPASP